MNESITTLCDGLDWYCVVRETQPSAVFFCQHVLEKALRAV